MASHPASTYHRPVETDSGAFFKIAALLLGLLVAVVGFFALLLWADAREARDDASSAAAEASAGVRAHEEQNTPPPLNSFARRVLHLPLRGERPGRLHVPLRDEAGARAHRERHVRRDRRPPERHAGCGQGVRAR